MRFFILVGTIPIVFNILFYVVHLVFERTSIISLDFYILCSRIDIFIMFWYPFLQAYGMIALKDNKDCISGISNLN